MKDNFSNQAGDYAKYRPAYPQQLYDFIGKLVAQKEAAWDCGTGNGQSAAALAAGFNKVYATDISAQQISHATQVANVFYSVQAAESTNFPNDNFDLITVAQAIHWFDFATFYREVNRVAKPGGILAVWGYSLLQVSPEIDKLIHDYHFNTLADYWDPERKYLDEGYSNIPFPFAKIDTPAFKIKLAWTLEELRGYLGTWSALQKFIRANGFSPLDSLINDINPFWDREAMEVIFDIHLLVARIEK